MIQKKITKALIPAAGFGTRFLPQTKAMPKEMMPLFDKPIIQRVVEELVDAGIETIIIVTGLYKRSIEDHFDNNYELEERLEKAGKLEELEMVRKISNMAEFIYIRQKGPAGNATPILNAKHILGDDPFMVFWADDFIDASPSRAKQLIEAYEEHGTSILGGLKIDTEDGYRKYAYVGGEKVSENVVKVQKIIEKPGIDREGLSDLAIISGFIATSDIYKHLEKAKENLTGREELVYTLGFQGMATAGIDVHALELRNALYRDTGNKLEYLKTVVQYGLDNEEYGTAFKEYLLSLINSKN
jgi:UTP--glucose-1-phosphate uridylyltransferase